MKEPFEPPQPTTFEYRGFRVTMADMRYIAHALDGAPLEIPKQFTALEIKAAIDKYLDSA